MSHHDHFCVITNNLKTYHHHTINKKALPIVRRQPVILPLQFIYKVSHIPQHKQNMHVNIGHFIIFRVFQIEVATVNDDMCKVEKEKDAEEVAQKV